MWLFTKNQPDKTPQLQPLIIDHEQYQQLILPKQSFETKFQDAIIEERHKEIEIIAKEMQENHQLICAIAELTDIQGHIVDDIRHNITVSEKNVGSGNKNLSEAEEKQKTGNMLTIIFATVMGVIVTITTTVVALTV